MTPFKRIVIIFNPNSTGPSHDNAKALQEQLVEGGFAGAVELLPTERAGHAIELAESAAAPDGSTLIVSSSGDGGYNEVINGAFAAKQRGLQPVCAVLPSGNANDHRRTTKRRPLAQAILAGSIVSMDVIQVGISSQAEARPPRYAHSYVGIGLTPTIAVELNQVSLNAVREAAIVFKAFAQFQPLKIRTARREIAVDSLIISNVDGMAKVLKLAQHSRIDDGLLEVNVFPHGHKFRLLSRLLAAATVGLKPTLRVQAYEFSISDPAPMQLDGEVVELPTGATVSVQCERQALSVVI